MATFLFSFVTHNKKFGVRATRDVSNLKSPVTLTVTNMETGEETVKECKGELAARLEWKQIHRDNLK